MLYTIGIVLLLLWLLGYFVMDVGAVIHVLLVLALIVVLWRVITGRRPVA